MDVWKENILEDLERGLLEYKTVGEFLADIKKEFGEGDEEMVKVAELKRIEQGEKQWRSLFKNLEEQQGEVDMRRDP